MGDRGHTLHVLDGKRRATLARAGQRLAVLGRNDRWTTFVPLDAPAFDDERASTTLGRPLVHLWFDDDAGLLVRVFASGQLVGELAFAPEADVAPADLELCATLEELGVLTGPQRAELVERMSDASDLLAWAMGHGLERLMDLPSADPMPTDASEEDLRGLLPESARIVEPSMPRAAKAGARAPKAKVAPAATPGPPPKASWSASEAATLELHRDYWRTIFSMNNWKLYHRYKKHLPPDRRREVDDLCSAVALGDDEGVNDRVTSILARIWAAESWDEVIRDPELMDGDDDAWRAWLARVAT